MRPIVDKTLFRIYNLLSDDTLPFTKQKNMEKTGMNSGFKTEKRNLVAFFIATSVILLVSSMFLGYYAAYGDILFSILQNKKTKIEMYNEMNVTATKGITVFYGDSLTEFYDTSSAFHFPSHNRGISGDTTQGMIERIEGNLLSLKPSRVVFLGGTNDLNRGVMPEQIAENIGIIVEKIRADLPDCEIFVQSLYPVNPYTSPVYLNSVADRKNEDIQKVNALLAPLCDSLGCTYIDVHDALADEKGNLRKDLTMDGLHVNESGYAIVTKTLWEYLCRQ